MKNLKLFIRQFKKQKVTGFLSIGSLVLGIMVAIITGLWCYTEWSFDSFHHHPEQTYRITRKGFINDESVSLGGVCRLAGVELKEKMPEIKNMARLYFLSDYLTVGERTERVKNVYATDTNYHQILNFPLKYGSINDFESKPNAIIINEDWANKYFPDKNPIGEVVDFKGAKEVVAVMQNLPVNSSFDIEALIRIDNVSYLKDSEWGNHDGFITFLILDESTNIEELELKATEHASDRVPMYKTLDISYVLQPLKEIHLGHRHRFDHVKNTSEILVFSFAIMAILVLAIGCINFVNLFISSSFLRAKSIGVKKTNGAVKGSLVLEFFSETLIYTVLSTAIAIGLARLLLPLFGGLVGYDLKIDFSSPLLYVYLAALIGITTLASGAFPAFYMTRFNPVETLKNQFTGNKVSLLQKSLLIFQFTASLILLTSTIVIKKQISHLQNMDLGFNKENIVHIEMNENFREHYERLAMELKAHPDVLDVTAKNATPLEWTQGNPISRVDNPGEENIMEICFVKPNYFEVMGMPIVEGENPFGKNDSLNYCVINEAAAKILGGGDILDKRVRIIEEDFIVKGIVKDAYTKSLHQTVDPQVYRAMWNKQYGVFMMKTRNNPKQAIQALNKLWMQEAPNRPFEYRFLDEDYAKLYHKEEISSQIATWLMVFAFLISIAGLFGIARYVINRRTKEIGIRKVNGAKVANIISSLNLTFVKWVALSFVIACPVSWYLMHRWLGDFAIKTEISWWVFLLTGLCALAVTLITVSMQSYKAATQNPVKCLKYE